MRMIDKNTILKFVKHVHKRNRGVSDRRLIHPRREWLLSFFVFLVVVITGAWFSSGSFELYKNIDSQDYEVDTPVPAYDTALAETVLLMYSEREAGYSSLVGRVASVPVPVADSEGETEGEVDTDQDTSDQNVPDKEKEKCDLVVPEEEIATTSAPVASADSFEVVE